MDAGEGIKVASFSHATLGESEIFSGGVYEYEKEERSRVIR